MLVVIVLSLLPLLPLAFKENHEHFALLDSICVFIFILDYLLRWMVADFKLKNYKKPFLKYPFTPMALVDLISILPSISFVSNSLRLLRMLRMIRVMRVFRVFKVFRYSKSIDRLGAVLKETKESLLAVCFFAGGYLLISALIMLNVELESFDNFFEALYWATVTLTTVGYGDLYTLSAIGRFVAMESSFFGIAVVALPAGYMRILERERENIE